MKEHTEGKSIKDFLGSPQIPADRGKRVRQKCQVALGRSSAVRLRFRSAAVDVPTEFDAFSRPSDRLCFWCRFLHGDVRPLDVEPGMDRFP